jgi:alkylation response protein AidB-like acyl-CoA dehydrogenase
MKDPETQTLDPEEKRSSSEIAPAGGAFLVEPVVQRVFTREDFSVEQREIELMVRQFADERLRPAADDIEKLDRDLSLKLMREVGELGLAAIDIPEKYGGMALRKSTSALVVEALTTGGSASWIVTFSAHVGIGTLPIVFFGTEEQKQKYLPKLGSVEYLGAYALTEPESEMWITNVGWADLYVVFANLEGAGVTAFLVERGTEGLSTGNEEHKLGIKGSSTVVLNLENVRVPKENLLGEPGGGVPIALNVLNIGRFKLGAADLGGCKMLVDQSTQYALERLQFGQPIAHFEAIRKKLAEMVVRTYALDSAIYRTVGMMDQRISTLDHDDPKYPKRVMAALEEYAIESSITKIQGSETMAKVVDEGVQIYGGYGFSEEYPMARAYRDARIDRIFEGTNEINRMIIYGYYLRKALMEELPIRDAEKVWDSPLPEHEGPLAWEIAGLDVARRLTVKSYFQAISIFGQDLRNAQIVGEDLADLTIGYFAASASINRILQQSSNGQVDRTQLALARLTAAAHFEDVHRLMYRLRPSLFGDEYGQKALATIDSELQKLQLPFDPVEEVNYLTDGLYDRGSYPF